jgi:hypothetical protein
MVREAAGGALGERSQAQRQRAMSETSAAPAAKLSKRKAIDRRGATYFLQMFRLPFSVAIATWPSPPPSVKLSS